MVSTDKFCEISLLFTAKKLECYYTFYAYGLADHIYIFKDYPKTLEMIRDDTLAKYLALEEKIRSIEIFSMFSMHECKITPQEYNLIIQYITSNIPTRTLSIDMYGIEPDLSQMQPCIDLYIKDPTGSLPAEYLHHLIKLLENGKAKNITFQYKKELSLVEDLAQFDNIQVEINPARTHDGMYLFKLKD